MTKDKVKKVKTAEDKAAYKTKRWFFGLGKEFNRITWTPKKKMLINFVVVIGITVFFVLLFLLIDFIILDII
ncbi:MAG: hypothetical protein Ta2E_06850 [Mycoplasmoidaceae bacterium]|nr:MAG: hypothetical protein Ta2E_06850 [Mycoplasmoidaceae bacterium]